MNEILKAAAYLLKQINLYSLYSIHNHTLAKRSIDYLIYIPGYVLFRDAFQNIPSVVSFTKLAPKITFVKLPPPSHFWGNFILKCGKKEKRIKMTDVIANLSNESWGSR